MTVSDGVSLSYTVWRHETYQGIVNLALIFGLRDRSTIQVLRYETHRSNESIGVYGLADERVESARHQVASDLVVLLRQPVLG